MDTSCHRWTACALTGALVVLLLAVAVPSSLAAEAGTAPAGATGPPAESEMKVFIPIKEARIKQAPAQPPSIPEPKRSVASKAITTSYKTVGKVSFMPIPGTVVPVWWLALGLLTVPLARLWQRWTASMFA